MAEVLADLARADSEFQSLGAATVNARAAKAVLTGGSCSRGAVDERLIDGDTAGRAATTDDRTSWSCNNGCQLEVDPLPYRQPV